MTLNRSILSLLAVLGISMGMSSVGQAEVLKRGFLSSLDGKSPVRIGAYEEIHRVKLTAGQTYVIDLMSKDFDPYLIIEDSRGRRITTDDDGGIGLNSRVIFTPRRSGTYRIVVTSYRVRATGNFTLRVSP